LLGASAQLPLHGLTVIPSSYYCAGIVTDAAGPV
jgi:hypothetical protein